jgi:hypothetical protein
MGKCEHVQLDPSVWGWGRYQHQRPQPSCHRAQGNPNKTPAIHSSLGPCLDSQLEEWQQHRHTQLDAIFEAHPAWWRCRKAPLMYLAAWVPGSRSSRQIWAI